MKLERERKGLELEAEARQREGDRKEEAGEWNREVSASQVRYEFDKPAECTEGRDQWEPNYSHQHETHQTDTEEFKPSVAGRWPKDVPTRDWVGRRQSLTEIAHTTRHFKRTEDELAQRRQQLVDEIRHNDLLTQRVREDNFRWKRSLESRVGSQSFAQITQKRKGIPPVYEAILPD